jgi:hypothetical protein
MTADRLASNDQQSTKRTHLPWRTTLLLFWPAFWSLVFVVVVRDSGPNTHLGIRHLEDFLLGVAVVSCAGALGAIWALLEVLRARTLPQRLVAGVSLLFSAALASRGLPLL